VLKAEACMAIGRRFLVGDCLRSCDCMETKTSGPLNITKLSNHTMKPTAPDRMIASVLATDPARGLSLSR